MVLGTAMLVKGLASLGSFVKDKAVDAVTRPFKDAISGFKDDLTGSFGELGSLASGVARNVVRPDQALKIRLSSAFEQKLMSVREPILNVSEFKVEQIRGDDPLKSIDKIHANIVGYLNIVNKNTTQTFEYVRSSVKQQNVRVEDIKKSTAVIHKSYNDLSERITKLNIRVSDLERKKTTPGLGAPEEKLKSSEDPNMLNGLLSGLGNAATGVAAGAGGGLLARALKGMMRGGATVTPLILAQMLKDYAAKDENNEGRSEARRILLPWLKMFGLSKDDVETPEDKAKPPPWEKDPERDGGNSQWERERQQGVLGRIQSHEDAREKGVAGSAYRAFHPDTPHSFNERFGAWDKNERTGASIEKYELKKQSISMQSASDLKMSAQQSIELKARSIVLKATDCISLDAPKIIFSTCPTIKSSDGLQKLINQCMGGEDDTIPENAKPTSGELPGRRTRMPGGRGMGGLSGGGLSGGSSSGGGMGGGGLSGGNGGGSMSGGGLSGGGAGGAGMGGGGLSGGRGGSMGIGGGTGSFAGGGGGGGFAGRGASGSWGGIPDTAIDRDPNTPAFGSSYGQGRSFAGAGGSGGAFGGRTGVYNTPGGAGMVYPSAGRRRDSTGGPRTTTTNQPPKVPLIEETYPGLGKGGTGPDPLIPSRDDPTKPADPNDTRKSITLEDIQRAVYNPGDPSEGDDNPYATNLQGARKEWAEAMKDPEFARRVAAQVEAEVGGQGEKTKQAFLETVMNRSLARSDKEKLTPQQILDDKRYFPSTTLDKRNKPWKEMNKEEHEKIQRKVLSGSNVSDFATGNYSQDASKGYVGAPVGATNVTGLNRGKVTFVGNKGVVGGQNTEYIGQEGPDIGWERRLGPAQGPTVPTKPGQLLRTQDVDPDAYEKTKTPPYQANRDREAREGKTGTGPVDASGGNAEWGPAFKGMGLPGPDQNVQDTSIKGRHREGGTRYHAGADYYVKPGEDLMSQGKGKVVDIINADQHGTGNYGHTVVVEYANGKVVQYSHLSPDSAKVKKGDSVERGQVIATTGASGTFAGVRIAKGQDPYVGGDVTPPHVHIEVVDKKNYKGSGTVGGTSVPNRENVLLQPHEVFGFPKYDPNAPQRPAPIPTANTAGGQNAATSTTTSTTQQQTFPGTIDISRRNGVPLMDYERLGPTERGKAVGATSGPMEGDPKGIIFHHTEGTSVEGAIGGMNERRNAVQYIIGLDKDGNAQVYQTLGTGQTGAHISSAELPTTGPYSKEQGIGISNKNTIGIELVGYEGRIDPKITAKAREFGLWLMKTNPNAVILGHGDVNPRGKEGQDISKWLRENAPAKAPKSPVVSDASPDPVKAGQQYAGLTTTPKVITQQDIEEMERQRIGAAGGYANNAAAKPPPPFLPPGMTPHSGPQYNPPAKLGVRSDYDPATGLPSLTPGGKPVPVDTTQSLLRPVGSDVGAPLDIRSDDQKGVGPPLDIRSDAQKAQDSPVHPNQPAMRTQADVNKHLADLASKRKKEKLNWKGSVVDTMKLLGMDSSQKSRIKLAKELGYTGPNNSRSRNVWLQQKLRSKLMVPPVDTGPEEGEGKGKRLDPNVPLEEQLGTRDIPPGSPLDIRPDAQKIDTFDDRFGFPDTTLPDQLGITDIPGPSGRPHETVLGGTPFNAAGVQGVPGGPSGPTGNLSKQLGSDDILPTATFDEQFGPSGRSRDTVLSGTPYGGDTAGVQGVPSGPSGPSGNIANQLGIGNIPTPDTFEDRFGFPKQETDDERFNEQLTKMRNKIPPIYTIDKIAAKKNDPMLPPTPITVRPTAISLPPISTVAPHIDQTKAAPAIVEATRTKDIEVDREKKRADDEKKKADESKDKERESKKEKDDDKVKNKKEKDEKPEEKIVKPTSNPETERKGPNDSGYGGNRDAADSTADKSEMQE